MGLALALLAAAQLLQVTPEGAEALPAALAGLRSASLALPDGVLAWHEKRNDADGITGDLLLGKRCVATARLAGGVMDRFSSEPQPPILIEDGVHWGTGWLPADVDWRLALGVSTPSEALAAARAASAALWSDFAAPDTEVLHVRTSVEHELEVVVLKVISHPHPDMALSAEVAVWPWTNRVVAMRRQDPPVQLPVQPKLARAQATELALRHVRSNHPSFKPTQTRTVLLAGDPLVWGVVLLAPPLVGAKGLPPACGVEVDDRTGRVLGTSIGREVDVMAGHLLQIDPQQREVGRMPRWPTWTPDGLCFVGPPPVRRFPWWKTAGCAAYIARGGRVEWAKQTFGAAGDTLLQTFVLGSTLLMLHSQGLTTMDTARGTEAHDASVRAVCPLPPGRFACTVADPERNVTSVCIRAVKSPTETDVIVARHAGTVRRLTGSADSRWLAYVVGAQVVVVDVLRLAIAGRTELGNVAVAEMAFVTLNNESSLVVRCLPAGGGQGRWWLIHPASGKRSELELSPAMASAAPSDLTAGPDGSVVCIAAPAGGVESQRRLCRWFVAQQHLEAIADAQCNEDAVPMQLGPAGDTADWACKAWDAEYRALYRRVGQ